MTLIVGLKCADGVVVGADGISTFGSIGGQTIRQATTKLEVIADRVVVGVSGSVGLAQRFKAEVEGLHSGGKLSGKTVTECGVILGDRFKEHIAKEVEAGRPFVPILGQGALPSFVSATLVAMFCKKEPQVIQFDHQ